MNNAPTLILASSSEAVTGKNLNKYLPKKLEDCKIAFIYTASKKSCTKDYLPRHRATMDEMKWNYIEVDITGKTPTQLKKLLSDCDVILVGGGNTFYLLKQVRKSGFAKVVKELISKGVVYIGTSAGSYITCPSIVMPTWKHPVKERCGVTNFKAMNLVTFSVFPHYTPEKLPLLKEKAPTLGTPLYLITDEQALVVKDDKIKFIGKGKKIIL